MNRLCLPFFVVLCFLSAYHAQAATLHQIDDFQADATTLGWSGLSEFSGPPERVEGGPAGAGDYYLEQHTIGFHLATYNATQWSGDYLAAGIGAVELDVNHLAGSDPVALRVAVTGPGGFFSSANPTPIAAGQWGHYLFGLTDLDLVYVSGGTGNLDATLSAVAKLLIRHDPFAQPTQPGFHPQHIVGTAGFDNIRAIREPSRNGDTNNDDKIDHVDFDNLVAQFGGSPGAEGADFNGDSIVDLYDFVLMRRSFGFGVPSAPNAEAPADAPEPATLIEKLA